MTYAINSATAKGSLLMLGVGLGLGGGCVAPSDAASFDTEGWIDTSPAGPPSPKPGIDGGGEEDGDEDEQDESGDDEGAQGPEAFWVVSGQLSGSNFENLGGEYFVEEGEAELCIITFSVSLAGAAADCEACAEAWEFDLTAPVEELNELGACESYGPGTIEGRRLRLGRDAEGILYQDAGEGWIDVGEALTEGGALVLEWAGDLP